MIFTIGKVILSRREMIALFVSQVNNAILATPGVRMHDTFWFYFTADDSL
jgi:hypothetical protein